MNDKINLTEMFQVLTKLSIEKSVCNKAISQLENALTEIEKYNEIVLNEINSLKEEGLTEKEEMELVINFNRLRNSAIIKACDLI